MFSNIFKTRAPATKIISLQDQLVIARNEARKQFQRANAAEHEAASLRCELADTKVRLSASVRRDPKTGRMMARAK